VLSTCTEEYPPSLIPRLFSLWDDEKEKVKWGRAWCPFTCDIAAG